MKMKGACLTVVAILALCAVVQPVLAAPVVSVEPAYVNVLQGQNFTVNITVDPAGAEVLSAQYVLYFNTTLLNATEQKKGPFLSQDGATTNVYSNTINNTIGQTKYGETRVGVEHGVTSAGTLTSVTFRALEPGICTLNLSKLKLIDPETAQPIEGVLINNGTVEINESIFVISGFVSYNDGSPVNNPNVTITNLDTTEVFIAETNESSNYYQVSTNLLHISEGDILDFYASDNLGNFTEFNHTVTEAEINAAGFSHDITIYVPDTTPPVITNVSVIPEKESAVITWETDEASDSMVKYGTEPGNYSKIVYNASYVTYHSIPVANLTSNTTYYYVVNSTDQSSNSAQSTEHNFTTFADIVISIVDAGTLPGENVTTSIIITNITDVGIADISLSYNQSLVHVIAVEDTDFDALEFTIDNTSGVTRIGVLQTVSAGLYGNVRLANVTLKAVGGGGTSCTLNLTINELKEASPDEISIPATTRNGTFTIAEITPPEVTNPIANPASIPEDTDFDPRWGETSQLNVTVTDDCGVANVFINLSTIGGSPDQLMTRIPDSDIWTVPVNASAGTAVYNVSYLPHNLTVSATDIFGNVNTSVSIQLTVVLNGDVSMNGEVSIFDASYIRKYMFGKPGFEVMDESVGEVSGNGVLSLYDSMYLSKHVLGEAGYETLH